MHNFNIPNTVNKIIEQKDIKDKIHEELYKRDRYKLDSTLSVIYVESEEMVNKLIEYIKEKKLIRIVDYMYAVHSQNYLVIFYSFCGEKETFKASQNLIHNIELKFGYENHVKIGISSCMDKKDPIDWVKHSVKAVEKALHEFGNTVEILH